MGLRTVAALAAASLVAAVAGCGGGGDKTTSTATPAAAPPPATTTATTPAPAQQPAGLAPGLAIGLTENNASLVRAPGSGPAVPAFEPWRKRITALRPALYRLPVDWAGLQPDPSKPANLALPA